MALQGATRPVVTGRVVLPPTGRPGAQRQLGGAEARPKRLFNSKLTTRNLGTKRVRNTPHPSLKGSLAQLSSALRWFIVAPIFIVAAFAGALYVHSFHPYTVATDAADTDPASDETGKVASIDVGSVLGPQVVDQQ